MDNSQSAFSGVASVRDIALAEWKECFRELESVQNEFLLQEPHFRSLAYASHWLSDALHTWSRVWEYPYVYRNLLNLQERGILSRHPVIADVGSGVTFFPFALARRGFRVLCVDHDPVCREDMDKAVRVVSAGPGSISSFTSTSTTIPLPDQSTDGVVCISVLEHVREPGPLVRELHRILSPGGVCFITIDLDLKGTLAIGPGEHAALMESIMSEFTLLYQERTVHPALILRSDSGPFPMHQPKRISIWRYQIQERIVGRMLGKPAGVVPVRALLAVQGLALQKPR